jgi:hypothetical protein
MLKKIVFLFLFFGLFTTITQGCFLFKGKNKCDSCPGIIKHKKTRKSTKGSI